MFEPTSWVDQALYALGMVVWPYCAAKMIVIGEFFTAFVLAMWSLISAVWTWRWVRTLWR